MHYINIWHTLPEAEKFTLAVSVILGPLLIVLVCWFCTKLAIKLANLRSGPQRQPKVEFEESRTLLKGHRGALCELARQYYRRHHLPARSVDPLIVVDGWIPDFTAGKPMLLRDVCVELVDSPSQSAPVLSSLPDGQAGYAANSNAYLSSSGRDEMKDKSAYRLMGVDVSDGVRLLVGRSRYFQFQDHCEVLAYEMAHAVHTSKGDRRWLGKLRNKGKGTTDLLDATGEERLKLKLRDDVRDVLDFRNRHVGIGINALTILLNAAPDRVSDRTSESNHQFLWHFRSGKHHNEAMGTYHVVPAGTYQPPSNDFECFESADKDLRNTVYREFGEELYNLPEFIHLLDIKELDKDETIKSLKARIANPESNYEIYFLGVGLDPLSTKCEIMGCITCDFKEWELPDFDYGIETKGDVDHLQLTKKNLQDCIEHPATIPAAKQILTIVLDNFDVFAKMGSQ